ncbi:protein hu-li tai shao-like isoform X5 [Daphnia pulex]|uniref:protein hu-li tai shao-like isoform X5 n=1 Tax=Daphnia pulex TaxID=6669 RepID=UPI001EDE318B|nr:protein hu-li tai shao-like isoform X5 [Daphnia pulex]XP_046446651.1 protein hu-li tai shao-like isoform X5 [Daphnia pulex]XP_046446652.1 protein hu-li tai shao-like isoform X5 [Daphnia pulex]XP_046446653.1 protein hu-li tai shao-like isoform X5 [Daphnia pulex]
MAAEAATTMAAAEQKLNGLDEQQLNGCEFDPNAVVDEDDLKKLRPPDIDADVRDMERRRRVEVMMGSRTFRDDLERIVDQQLREGGAAGLFALQQHISDLTGMGTHRGLGGGGGGGARCVIPINDIKGVDFPSYVKGEKIIRCKLAALYRLVDLFGWSQSIYNHITVRVSQEQEHFLLNPFGLLYSEVTASSLIKVDMQGNVVDPGTTNFGVNIAGFVLHSAIHAARPDAKCVVHIHHPACVAISALKCGFLPVSQESVLIGEVSYHDYYGILVDPEERESIARNLGPLNKVMFLRNHGLVILGETIEEAFFRACNTVLACESQIRMMPVGLDNLIMISEDAKRRSQEVAKRANEFTRAGRNNVTLTGVETGEQPEQEEVKEKPRTREVKWRQGDMEFEAYMRMLDNSGYRSGYPYRVHSVRTELPRQKHDVEVPPAVSSFGYMIEEDELYKNSPLRKLLDGRRTLDKNRWINSPNVYQKVEVVEQGTQDPKKITKWVPDGSPTHSSTPFKLEIAHQFVPMGTTSKEFKQKQKQIKENRRQGGISAGPQSHILEGVSWDEAQKLQDANTSGTGDHVVVVGAASKGIIQRDFQHHAMVYRTPYAKNPFDSVSDQEIEEYKRQVEMSQKGISEEHEVSYSTTEAPTMEPLVAESVVLSPSGEQVRPERKSSPTSPRPLSDDEGAEVNGDEIDNPQSQVSQSSRDESSARDMSTEDSPSKSKDKKKKKGLRTPSFLKKKSKEKKKPTPEA